MTLSDFITRLGNPGFEIMPNGLIRQWGTLSLQQVGNYNAWTIGGITYYTHYSEIVLPMAFPNGSDSVNVTIACSTMYNQTSMGRISCSANLNGSPTKFTVAITTASLGYVPTIHYQIIGH